jgi:hypothetical protein
MRDLEPETQDMLRELALRTGLSPEDADKVVDRVSGLVAEECDSVIAHMRRLRRVAPRRQRVLVQSALLGEAVLAVAEMIRDGGDEQRGIDLMTWAGELVHRMNEWG